MLPDSAMRITRMTRNTIQRMKVRNRDTRMLLILRAFRWMNSRQKNSRQKNSRQMSSR